MACIHAHIWTFVLVLLVASLAGAYVPSQRLRSLHSVHSGHSDVSVRRGIGSIACAVNGRAGGRCATLAHGGPSYRLAATTDLELVLYDERKSISSAPTLGALLLFGLPTLGSWLLQPILSLIDTSVVGMSASIFELAALGPGIAWCDSTAYLFNFVGVATTNLCATALAKGDTDGWRQSVSDAMAISLFFGLGLGVFQVVMAPWVITLLCGTATDAVPFALDYVRIRALAAPVAIPMIVTQAAFLANQDSITPLKAVFLGGLANLVGDLILTTYMGWGLFGAAIATAFSQFVSFFYLVGIVWFRIKKQAQELTAAGSPHTTRQRLGEMAKRPTWAGIKQFAGFCGPLSFVLLAKSVLWSYTTLAASTSGVTSLAAHQITINFFLFFAIFGDTVSQMVQTFIPGRYGEGVVHDGEEVPLLVAPLVGEEDSRALRAVQAEAAAAAAGVGMSVSQPMFRPDTVSDSVSLSSLSSGNSSRSRSSSSSSSSCCSSCSCGSSSSSASVGGGGLTDIGGVMGSSAVEQKEKKVRFVSYFKKGPTVAGNEADVTMGRITRLAVAFGIANLVLARWLPSIATKFFTKDAAVAASIAQIAPYVMCAVALHCPMCALEGSLFATRDLSFVVVAYIMSGAGFLSYQTYVRNMGLGTFGVWRGMAVYQLWRFCLFSWRVRTNTFKPLPRARRHARRHAVAIVGGAEQLPAPPNPFVG